MSLWEGRFKENTDQQMWTLNTSIGFDRRMAAQDVRGSLAWVAALEDARVLTADERTKIEAGLLSIEAEFQSRSFDFAPGDEDIHTAVERRLGELIGPLAGKLHTGRSRNDQVATDFRLWMLDHLPGLDAALVDLQAALVERAENDLKNSLIPNPSPEGRRESVLPSPSGSTASEMLRTGAGGEGSYPSLEGRKESVSPSPGGSTASEMLRTGAGGEGSYILMPGYTHLQRAQPILLSHWWLSHFWPLQRDRERLADLRPRLAILPLGSGALAGVPFEIDRATLADELGFDAPSPNSIDAVSDRDFAAEFLFSAALTGVHLSRLAESVILFTSAEFSFFELSDAYSTGSSLMPQKKNPDPFELARGKAGTLLGKLVGLLTTLKGLPSTYDKDLQEDKVPVFEAYDTLMALLPVIAGALRTLTIRAGRMEAAIDASMMSTDLADYLIGCGIPFREAHALAGQAVRLALNNGKSLQALTLAEYQSIHSGFGNDVYAVFDPQKCVARRKAFGGTAPKAVKAQLEQAKLRMRLDNYDKGC